MAVPEAEINFSHKDANWRDLCAKEIKTTSAFEANWSFMCDREGAKAKLEARRAQPSTLVKYRDAKGGNWTVRRKMVPEITKGATDQDISSKPDPLSRKMETMAPTPMHVSTNMDYGSRFTLEQFGIAGVSAVPKLPPLSIDEIEAQVRKQRREQMGYDFN